MVDIRGVQKLSLIDYPDQLSCIVFLFGCNFRCHYCHNPELVLEKNMPKISEEEFFQFLESRKDYLDGVVITGGEPTLQKDLVSFIEKIRQRNFLVKLDTNGTNPEILKILLEKKLVDYIAMDIKAQLEKYANIINVETNIEKIKESMSLIGSADVKYEFRTTVLPKLLKKEDILKIAQLLKGSEKYVLQNFNPGKTLNKEFENEISYSQEELQEFVELIKNSFNQVEIRG